MKAGQCMEPQLHPSPYLPQLDGMRGLAALSVVLAHFNPSPLKVQPESGIGLLITASREVALGNLAVVLFFVLSGFLLTYLARREFHATGHFSIRHFFVRRVLRIWPLYFTVVAVAYFLQSRYDHLTPEFAATAETWRWITNHFSLFALFAGNWSLAFNHVGSFVDHSPGLLRILWSIGVEEQFYAVYPFLIFLVLRHPQIRLGIALLILLIAWGFRIWFCTLNVTQPAMQSAGGMYYATLSYGDVLLAGVIAGWLAAKPDSLHPRSLLFHAWLGPVLLILALGVGLLWAEHLWYPYSGVSVAGYGLVGILFALFLLWAKACADHPLTRLLASRPLRWLGTLSYGIYMWHVLSNTCLAAALNAWGRNTYLFSSPWLRLVCSVAAAVAFASFSHWAIERPFLNIKARYRPHPLSTQL